MAPKLQEDWLGTKVISISLCLLSLFTGIPLLGATGRNPGHGTKIARGLVRYTDIGYCSLGLLLNSSVYVTLELQEDELVLLLIMILKSFISISLLQPGATRCHGTRIARGVPLSVYMNLDLYSGFWCTSHCVVF